MHNKAVFAVAGVFLAVAVVVPTVIFILQAQNDLIVIQNPTGMYTGNVSGVPTVGQIQASHQNTLIIVAVIEVVFVALFVVTVYYGINHIHPSHKPPGRDDQSVVADQNA